jgi:hypothetical protein
LRQPKTDAARILTALPAVKLLLTTDDEGDRQMMLSIQHFLH